MRCHHRQIFHVIVRFAVNVVRFALIVVNFAINAEKTDVALDT